LGAAEEVLEDPYLSVQEGVAARNDFRDFGCVSEETMFYTADPRPEKCSEPFNKNMMNMMNMMNTVWLSLPGVFQEGSVCSVRQVPHVCAC